MTLATLVVELGVASASAGNALFDTAVFNTATFGADQVWTDVSGYVRSCSTSRGRSRAQGSYPPGSGSLVLDNRDGRFSPANLSGPFAAGGVSMLAARVPVRISAVWSGVTYRLFTGRVAGWGETFSPEASTAVAMVSLVEVLADLSVDGFEQASQGAGETSGQRIQRVASNARWSWPVSADVGRTTVQATTLASNALSEAILTADSEAGALWCDPDGSLVFESGYALVENIRSSSTQATFGDGVGELRFVGIEAPRLDTDTMVNDMSAARAGGTATRVVDEASIAANGVQASRRFDLVCETDTQAAFVASWTVAQNARPEYRCGAITIDPQIDNTGLWPQVLGRRIRDRVRVLRRPASGVVFDQLCFIEGVSHQIDPGARSWRTTFQLSSATVAATFSTSRFDTAKFDTATFFF